MRACVCFQASPLSSQRVSAGGWMLCWAPGARRGWGHEQQRRNAFSPPCLSYLPYPWSRSMRVCCRKRGERCRGRRGCGWVCERRAVCVEGAGRRPRSKTEGEESAGLTSRNFKTTTKQRSTKRAQAAPLSLSPPILPILSIHIPPNPLTPPPLPLRPLGSALRPHLPPPPPLPPQPSRPAPSGPRAAGRLARKCRPGLGGPQNFRP